MDERIQVKCATCRHRNGVWSFQCIFNTLLVGFFILSCIGLWACLTEIRKLKQATDSFQETIDLVQVIPNDNTVNVKEGLQERDSQRNATYRTFVRRAKQYSNISKELNQHSKVHKIMNKRDVLPTYRMRDPLSNAPSKDMVEYCRNVIYDICTSSIPGAPGAGPPGPPGPPGNKGEPGHPGAMGHMGPPGLDGQKGHKGDKGDTGRVGEPGADGPRGSPGYPGVNGIQGATGPRGKRGMPGRPGHEGQDGTPGVPGLKGEKGEPGDPAGAISYKDGNCTCIHVKGEKGERGHVGFYGYKGAKGVGIKGEKGLRGLVGFTGYKGDKGDPGLKGEKGYGMPGFSGARGPEGPKGEKGDPGFCRAANCGDKYVRQTPSQQNHDSYTIAAMTTTMKPTTSTMSTTPSTQPPTLEPRATVCRLKKISTPVFIKRERSVYGSILGDPTHPGQFWVTRGYYGHLLEQYDSMDNLKNLVISKRFNTRINRFFGTQHAIFNQSFYYQFLGKPHIVRYDLKIGDVATAVKIPGSHYNDSNYLYKDSKIYYDITADENGLWVVYGRHRGNGSYVHVLKADQMTLDVQKVWRLPVEIGVYKNGFIACGILYLVKDLDPGQTEAEIDFAYDLYKDETDSVNIKLKIPFGENAMFTFYTNSSDRKNSVLLAWDKGNIIKYPLLF